MIWVWQTLTSPSSQPRGAVQVERRNFQTRVSKFHGTIWAHLLGSELQSPTCERLRGKRKQFPWVVELLSQLRPRTGRK